MTVYTYAPYGVLDVSGYWEKEDDDARFHDSSVWNLEAN